MMFALVDCNNFFVSCERVFNPALEKRPVAVLSNNDGCIIARSNEVKALGIAMGAPLFEVRAAIRQHGISIYSSNYALYGDMSARVMTVLKAFTPDIEVYSIDEAFLGLEGFQNYNLEDHARTIHQAVRRWTGIPVSIGIGPTKTLAKAAATLAKKAPAAKGVFDINGEDRRRAALSVIEIGDVWGIGRRWARMLKDNGLKTALDFHDMPEAWVRKRMGVVGARTLQELQGTACLGLEEQPPAKQTLRVSRSFAKAVNSREILRQSVAAFAVRAAEKLRRDSLASSVVNVFVRTNRFGPRDEYYKNTHSVAQPAPGNHTSDVVRAAMTALDAIYLPGLGYKQAGVTLLGLSRESEVQLTLFHPPDPARDARRKRLMTTLDDINTRIGSGALRYGAVGVQAKGRAGVYTVQNRRSPRYTTNWTELPVVRA